MNRLREIRRSRNLTQKQVADYLGIAQQSYRRYEVVDIKTISPDTILKLAKFFGISVDYILEISDKEIEKGYKIPVLGTIPAGIPINAIEEILDYEEIPHKMAKVGDFFALKVKGDSMSPRIQNGDVVIVRKQDDAESGDVCVVMVNGFDATLKQIKKDINGITLVPFNEHYKPMFYDNNSIKDLPVRILGVVVELRGKFKNI